MVLSTGGEKLEDTTTLPEPFFNNTTAKEFEFGFFQYEDKDLSVWSDGECEKYGGGLQQFEPGSKMQISQVFAVVGTILGFVGWLWTLLEGLICWHPRSWLPVCGVYLLAILFQSLTSLALKDEEFCETGNCKAGQGLYFTAGASSAYFLCLLIEALAPRSEPLLCQAYHNSLNESKNERTEEYESDSDDEAVDEEAPPTAPTTPTTPKSPRRSRRSNGQAKDDTKSNDNEFGSKKQKPVMSKAPSGRTAATSTDNSPSPKVRPKRSSAPVRKIPRTPKAPQKKSVSNITQTKKKNSSK